MKRIIYYLFATLALISCTNKALDGKWHVEHIDGVEIGDVFNEPCLEFDSDKSEYHGVTGVNIVNGTIKVVGNKITFKDGPMTRMAADPHSMSVETAYLKAIENTASFLIEDGTLLLKDDKGATLMELTKVNH